MLSSSWEYLKYILAHKRRVYRAGRELGVGRLQLLCHDLQKFSPKEWSTYRRNFFTSEPVPYGEFQQAWLHHQRIGGKHHWQYWIQVQNYGEISPLQMPEKYVREMVADWRAMGQAFGDEDSPLSWYDENRDKIVLHPENRKTVDELMERYRAFAEQKKKNEGEI